MHCLTTGGGIWEFIMEVILESIFNDIAQLVAQAVLESINCNGKRLEAEKFKANPLQQGSPVLTGELKGKRQSTAGILSYLYYEPCS